MANTRQKQKPEGANRRPGKSRFSLPEREAPPIDGSYLERLFADFQQQSQELEQPVPGAPGPAEPLPPAAEIPEESPVADITPAQPEPHPEIQATPEKAAEIHPSPAAESPVTAAPEAAAALPAPPTESRRKEPSAPASDRRALRRQTSTGDDAILLEKLKKKHRLGKGEIHVLGTMIRLCKESGADYCYVKIPQLMAASGLKERQTQVVLRSLRELELIEKLADYSNIDRLGTKYRVNFASF